MFRQRHGKIRITAHELLLLYCCKTSAALVTSTVSFGLSCYVFSSVAAFSSRELVRAGVSYYTYDGTQQCTWY